MMFADDLRKSVLQAAIQGQLTEQLPTDGDARDLLKKIQAEKANLIKAKKIKPVTLPPISDDELPFKIPPNWCWVRLGEIAETNIVLTYSPQDISDDGVIVLRSGNIAKGKINYNDLVKVKINIPKNKLTCAGDIIICARNGSKKLVGKAAMIDKANLSFGAFMAVVRSKFNQYILMVIHSPHFRKTFLNEVGTTTINQITQSMLKNFLIPLPPLAEQERIVAKLDEILSEIELLAADEHELEELEKNFPRQMKNSLLQAAIQGLLTEQLPTDGDARDLLKNIQAEKANLIKAKKIKPITLPPISDDELPFKIPPNWCWVRFGNICQIIGGGTPEKHKPEYWNGNINWATVADIQSNFLDTTEFCITPKGLKESSTNVIKQGAIIIATRVGLGKVCYTKIDTAINQDLKGVYLFGNLNYFYALYFFNAFASHIIKNGIGTTVKGVRLSFIENLLFPLPPLAEQKRIVAKLDALLQLCDI